MSAPMYEPGGWLHDLSPFLIEIGTGIGLRWYGLSYLAGFALAFFGLKRLAKRRLIALPQDRIIDAILTLVVGVMAGGRLGYCLFYRPSYLWTFDDAFPFWYVFKINEGGMSSHGGMIGVLIGCWILSRGFKPGTSAPDTAAPAARIGKAPLLHITDAVALVGPIGLMLGRIANFINGELLGKIVLQPAAQAETGATAPWWSVRYPQELLSDHGASVELSESQRLAYVRLLTDYQLVPDEPVATIIGRLIGLVQTGNTEVAARLAPLISARHPSQLYQAFAEGVVVLAVLWFIARVRRSPGVISAWFLIVYGTGRVLTELWRLPDAHFQGDPGMFDLSGPTPLGLSRGQWLSVLMVVAGLAMLIWRRTRPTDARYFGWSAPPSDAPAAAPTPAASDPD